MLEKVKKGCKFNFKKCYKIVIKKKDIKRGYENCQASVKDVDVKKTSNRSKNVTNICYNNVKISNKITIN